MHDLYVIEAPGKANAFRETLAAIGIEARVQATRGHLYQMPKRLNPVSIDSAFREFDRLPIDPAIVERLRKEAGEAKRVFVATDADQEGDVIAWDVARTVRDIHPDCMRVKLKGMDAESVREAVDSAFPVRREDAVPGRTRAIVDRMIGARFSHDGIAVGRVGTALLGLVASIRPNVLRLRLVAPAKDGGRPWVAVTDVKDPINERIARTLSALELPALDMESSTASKVSPNHTGDVMVKVGDVLDLSPSETQKSMQALYESGRLSYPRSASRAMSPSLALKMAKVFQEAGYQCVAGQWVKKGDEDVHDAPHPIGKVDPAANPRKLGADEGIRTIVARDLVRAGLQRTKQAPNLARLAKFLAEKGLPPAVNTKVCSLDWHREVGPKYPGEVGWPKSEVEVRRADTVLLEHAIEAGLGRPSTYPSHIDGFVGRGLVDDDLALTSKGEEWVAGSPRALLDPRTSALIERACETYPKGFLDVDDREPWEINAERIVRNLPEQIRGPLMASVASEPPRPLWDPLDHVEPRESFDIDDLVEERPGMAPRPSGSLYD